MVSIISTLDFPGSITIKSSVPDDLMRRMEDGGRRMEAMMGKYMMMITKYAQLRNVYKKTDGNYYISYSSKFLLRG